MSTGDDKNIEKYETDPRYQDEVAIRQETTRRWLIWGAGIVGLAVFMVALLSYLVWPPAVRTDPAATASTKAQTKKPQSNVPPAVSPTTIDRSPSPSGGGSGPTGVTSPTGTEKVR